MNKRPKKIQGYHIGGPLDDSYVDLLWACPKLAVDLDGQLQTYRRIGYFGNIAIYLYSSIDLAPAKYELH